MLSEEKYFFVTDIQNHEPNSLVPDIDFHPDQPLFAASYRDNHQLRVYNADDHAVIRTYQNPDARLYWPHGVLVADRYIIVTNRRDPNSRRSTLNVYAIDHSSEKPVFIFNAPFEQPWETHSMALHGERLLVTYYGDNNGAVVAYHFDGESGTISGPTDIQESFFTEHGSPKGVCFNEQGSRAVITFVTEKRYTSADKLRKVRRLLREKNGTLKTMVFLYSKSLNLFSALKKKREVAGSVTNGIVIYDVDDNGLFSGDPGQVILKAGFCRLENVTIAENLCAIADPVNGIVNLYHFDGENFSDTPFQVLADDLSFPHDVCFSPDRKRLLVSNYGLEVIDGRPQWGGYVYPRSDKIVVYELQG